MELRNIGSLVFSSEILTDWFERNQEIMEFYEMTHAGCLHYEDTMATNDIKVLGRMANAFFTCLGSKEDLPNAEKVNNTIFTMTGIYDRDKDLLSDGAKENYYISPQEKEKSSALK